MAETENGIKYAKSLEAIGFHKSRNGRTYAVFKDMDSGVKAATQSITTKLAGNRKLVTEKTTLAEFAKGCLKGRTLQTKKPKSPTQSTIT